MADLRQQLETSLGTSYSVERELGGGGMSRVFLAEETQLGRKVVIKLLAPEFAEGLSAERFEREIRLAAGLQEPHIVPVIAAGVAAGLPFYTMPFIAGESLRARLSLGQIPLREALAILTDVATALEYAHERGIVHRDIKPENILLSKRSAVVTDFGIAKAIADSRQRGGNFTLTAVGTSIGTPPYMAPEQIAADPTIDHRADLYALGVVAYEIFSGSTPFAGRTHTELVAAIMSEKPEPLSARRPDLPPALAALVMRLLSKDRLSRPASAAEVLRQLEDIDVTGAHRHSTGIVGKRRLVVGIVAAVLVVAGVGYTIRSRVDTQSLKEPDDAFWGGKDRSVAVLPLTTTNGDTAGEHFAEGLTDELISTLSKVQGLRVINRTSSSSKELKGLSSRAVGGTLKVASVVEGRVDRAEGRIRANVSLVRVSDGTILWTGKFDRKSTDLFEVQDEIVSVVVDSLHVRREGAAPAPIIRQPTRDLVAYDLYLEGRHFWNDRRPETLDSAAVRFESAIKRDTGFALAFSALADVYVLRTTTFRTQKELPLAEAAADRAIRLDPSLGEAYSSKGFVLMNRPVAFDTAEASFKKAFSLSPSYGWARHYYSLLLTAENRLEEAEAENQHALQIDPLMPGPNVHRATLLMMRGDHATARQILKSVIPRTPGFPVPRYYLGVLDASDGGYRDALASLKVARKQNPTFPGLRSALAYTYRHLGQTAKADSMVKELRASGDDDLALIDRALGEAVLGDNDLAYAMLARNPRWDFPSMIDLRANPLLEKFRQDRRYAALLGTIGLNR